MVCMADWTADGTYGLYGRLDDSGLGREHGTAAIDNFTEPKAVWINLNV